MIKADHIDMRQQRAQAVDRPAITGPPQSVPVVDRIAPELSLGAEIVRRYTGDETRPVARVQLEQLGVGPHVARIGRYEKRQIADQAHALVDSVPPEPPPLPKQQELREANLVDPVG